MKLQLLNSRIELFNSQLEMWESKPQELERRLMAVDRRIQQLNFDPVTLNSRLNEIETGMEDLHKALEKSRKRRTGLFRPDSVILEPYKSAIAVNPVRLLEGTFHISYERAISQKLGITIAGLATYATEEGISGFYMSNQKLDYYNAALDSSIPYHNKNISGYGVEMKLRQR